MPYIPLRDATVSARRLNGKRRDGPTLGEPGDALRTPEAEEDRISNRTDLCHAICEAVSFPSVNLQMTVYLHNANRIGPHHIVPILRK